MATCAESITRCEGSHLGVAGVIIPFAYHLLTICLPCPYQFLITSLLVARRAELTTRCEGSRFGVACGGVQFPYQLLTISLPIAYNILTNSLLLPYWSLDVQN